MKKRISLTGILLLSLSGFLNSQTFINPNYSLKSHETLNIIKVEAKPEATIFYMSIENQIEGEASVLIRIFISFIPTGKKQAGIIFGYPGMPQYL